MVGCPGDADAVVVWAKPDSPLDPIESPWGQGSMASLSPRISNGVWQTATLLDGDFHSNNFEAALKFNHGGALAYYPGGVHAILRTPEQVLHVFNCLAWTQHAGGYNCKIAEVAANYRPGACAPGMVRECYVHST
jgi:hypothetical protein